MRGEPNHRNATLAAPEPRTRTPLGDAVIVIPTRNRARLAELAIDSVLCQRTPDVRVLVSDNSTDRQERDSLAAHCSRLDPDVVRYVTPPASLGMAPHWQWVLEQALELDATHYTYLPDRRVFKPGGLTALLGVRAGHPDKVIAYNEDVVDDWVDPVRLQLKQWSGDLLEVDSSELLDLCSRVVLGDHIPRMMNCLVPRSVFDRIAERCSTVFDSIAPDYCFAFRCLAATDTFLYYDRSILVAHALDRSNGMSYLRGVDSPDRRDFGAALGETQRNFAAPVPELHGNVNEIMHEYCHLRNELGPARFPSVDRDRYLAAIGRELAFVENETVRSSMRSALVAAGWRPVGPYSRLRAFVARQRRGPLVVARRLATRLADRVSARLLGSPATASLWSRLTGRSFPIPAPGVTRFASASDALEFACRYSRRPTREPIGLEPVLDHPGTRVVVPRRHIGA